MCDYSVARLPAGYSALFALRIFETAGCAGGGTEGSIRCDAGAPGRRGGAAAWADKDSTDDDASYWWFGAGYDVAVYEIGTTSFAIGYGESNDETAVDAEVDKFEIGVSQAISSAGTTLYAGWRTWDFAIETQTNGQNDSFDDIMSFVAGAKVTF